MINMVSKSLKQVMYQSKCYMICYSHYEMVWEGRKNERNSRLRNEAKIKDQKSS